MKLKITVAGQTYEVDVEVSDAEAPHPTYVPPAAPTGAPVAKLVDNPAAAAPQRPASTVTDEAKLCRSPIAGVVTRVSAQVGQSVQANDVLLVLEAMKMETVITSPIAGKIARISANVGDAVQPGRVLVEFD